MATTAPDFRVRLTADPAEDRNAPGSIWAAFDPLADPLGTAPASATSPPVGPAVWSSSTLGKADRAVPPPAAEPVWVGDARPATAADASPAVSTPLRKADSEIMWDPAVTLFRGSGGDFARPADAGGGARAADATFVAAQPSGGQA